MKAESSADIAPPSKEGRWDIDDRGEGVADAMVAAGRIAELRIHAEKPRWVTEEPELHLWPHIDRALRTAGSPWLEGAGSTDADGRLVVELVHEPVEEERARAVVVADTLRLLGLVVESATFLEIVESVASDPITIDVVTGVLDDQTPFRAHGHTLRLRVTTRGWEVGWWRWGRVELPVQDPSPETTTSVSDGLSSTARTNIGTLPDGPVTCP